MKPTAAATALIKSFGQQTPPKAHSVWVRTEVDRSTGEATVMLCVAKSPTLGQHIRVPAEFQGYPVREMPWGRVAGE